MPTGTFQAEILNFKYKARDVYSFSVQLDHFINEFIGVTGRTPERILVNEHTLNEILRAVSGSEFEQNGPLRAVRLFGIQALIQKDLPDNQVVLEYGTPADGSYIGAVCAFTLEKEDGDFDVDAPTNEGPSEDQLVALREILDLATEYPDAKIGSLLVNAMLLSDIASMGVLSNVSNGELAAIVRRYRDEYNGPTEK